MRIDPRTRLLVLCAGGPPVVLTVFVACTLVASVFTRHPMWHAATLNMAEAAVARDVATVAAMLDRGEDPNIKRAIRAPLLDSTGVELTPLEAGVIAGRLEVVDLLLARGAAVDPVQRRQLARQARDRGYADIASYLTDPPAPLDCR